MQLVISQKILPRNRLPTPARPVLHPRLVKGGSAVKARSFGMGVAYHAHARFLDQQGHKITVPAPVDPQTPTVPWWYDWIAMNAAGLRHVGFTAILYPPVCKTQSGHFNTGDGYGVYDQYDIGSKNQMGSVETPRAAPALDRGCPCLRARRLYRRGFAPADRCRQRGLSVFGRKWCRGAWPLPEEPRLLPRRTATASGGSGPRAGRRFRLWRRAGVCQLRAAGLHDHWDDRFRRLADPLARLPGLPGRRHKRDGGRLCKAMDEHQGDDRPVLSQRIFRRESPEPLRLGGGWHGWPLRSLRFFDAFRIAAHVRRYRFRHASARRPGLYRTGPTALGDLCRQPGYGPVARRADHHQQIARLCLHSDDRRLPVRLPQGLQHGARLLRAKAGDR